LGLKEKSFVTIIENHSRRGVNKSPGQKGQRRSPPEKKRSHLEGQNAVNRRD